MMNMTTTTTSSTSTTNDDDDGDDTERCNSRFWTISLHSELSSTFTLKAAIAQLCAHHMQHVGHLSCVTYSALHGMQGQFSY